MLYQNCELENENLNPPMLGKLTGRRKCGEFNPIPVEGGGGFLRLPPDVFGDNSKCIGHSLFNFFTFLLHDPHFRLKAGPLYLLPECLILPLPD